jgi:hypothetical protein
MIEDPVVEELHKIREEMLEKYGGLEGWVKHLREVQAEMGPVVTLDPKPPVRRKLYLAMSGEIAKQLDAQGVSEEQIEREFSEHKKRRRR